MEIEVGRVVSLTYDGTLIWSCIRGLAGRFALPRRLNEAGLFYEPQPQDAAALKKF